MTNLRIVDLDKDFGDGLVVDGLDLDIPSGSFVTIVGPSGCGKTTTLRMVAGLERPSGGQILFDDDDVTDLSPQDREIGMVFQNYALFPHMSVETNIGYGLRVNGVPKEERAERVRKAAAQVEMENYLARYPRELSGGQRQRVAFARAVVREPRIILFDEPLSNLDAKLRDQTRAELKALHKRIGGTFLYVTHDQLEALTLSDRIAVMLNGRLEQFDTPTNVFEWPESVFVAQFIGSPPMNVLDAEFQLSSEDHEAPARLRFGDRGELGLNCSSGDLASALGESQPKCRVGVRPQYLTLAEPEAAPLAGVVEVVELIGTEKIVHVAIGSQRLVVIAPAQRRVVEGTKVGVETSPCNLRLFDSESGEAQRHLDALVSGGPPSGSEQS